MRIEQITPDDCGEVLQLNESSVPHVSSIDATRLQWFLDYAAYTRMVRAEDGIAAFIIGLRPHTDYASPNYRWFCDRYEDFAYVDRIAVAPFAKRCGIAEMLYKDFAETRPEAPIMTCEVNIRPSNEASMKFHERLGFHQVGTLESDGGEKAVAMLERVL
ncbi:MAG: GNAT family N-acetyltransferase [Gammaproteobacteria bacterium]|nr:GNAT family N-acetyltransferase [Gammaproteobacteria bacterium]